MIKIGDKLPAVNLREYLEVAGEGCSIGPNDVDVAAASAGKTIALFALPGAFTPTCSNPCVPCMDGFVIPEGERAGQCCGPKCIQKRCPSLGWRPLLGVPV